jgi:hypothetical protein
MRHGLSLLVALLLLCAFGASAQITAQAVAHFQPPVEGSDYNAGYTTTQDSQNAEGGSPVEFFGGTAPYTCSITSGSLPTGMSLKTVVPTGGYSSVICPLYGTPSVSGDFTITIKVTDSLSNTASQSVTFPVMDDTTARTNCTPTGVGNSTTSSGATITWTTTNACSSQVFYGPDGMFGTMGVQDSTGVTSHSYVITGLHAKSSGADPSPSGSGVYFGTIRSCGISGGAPADYLCEEYGAAGSSGPSLFTTASGASAGTATFTVEIEGPHNVYQSYPLIAQIFQSCTSGCSDYTGTGVKFQVTGLPSYTQVHWPYTQDWGQTGGYNGCTVTTTTTTNDTCQFAAEGGYANTQFEILQNVGGTTPTGNYTLTLKTFGGSTHVEVDTTWVMNVNALPTFNQNHPTSQAPVPGYATWLSNLTSYDVKWYQTYNCAVSASGGGFYDGQGVSIFALQLTGNTSEWTTNIGNCLTAYYNYENPLSWNGVGIYLQTRGSFWNSVVNNTTNANTAVTESQTCCGGNYFNTNGALIFPFASGNYAREAAFMFEAKRLNYDNGGATTLAAVQQMETIVLGIMDQYANDDNATIQEAFMCGLMMQEVIEYELDPHTGNMQDAARVYGSVKALWDHMMTEWYVPWAGTNGAWIYERSQAIATNNLEFSQPVTGNLILQDLNPLVTSGAAWIWAETNNSAYELQGDTLQYAGIVEPTGDGVNYFGKTYSQDYRWSFSYMRWRGEITVCTEFGGAATPGSQTAQNCSLDPLSTVNSLPAPANVFFSMAKDVKEFLEGK